MSEEQIKTAMERVVADINKEDKVIVFDSSVALFLPSNEVIDYALGKDISLLRIRLLKKWMEFKYSTNLGAYKAGTMATHHSKRICLTDDYLPKEDLRYFEEIIRIDDRSHGEID
jgi:hypothetical protein